MSAESAATSVIDLGVAPMPPPVDERRRPHRALPLGLLILAGALVLPTTITVPEPIHGTVVRASSVDFCSNVDYAGVTVTLVNQEPTPVRMTAVRPTFSSGVSGLIVAMRREGSPDSCGAGRSASGPIIIPPGGLGLIQLGYPAGCWAGQGSSMIGLDVDLTDGRRTVRRDVLAGAAPVDLPGSGECGADPEPPSGTGS